MLWRLCPGSKTLWLAKGRGLLGARPGKAHKQCVCISSGFQALHAQTPQPAHACPSRRVVRAWSLAGGTYVLLRNQAQGIEKLALIVNDLNPTPQSQHPTLTHTHTNMYKNIHSTRHAHSYRH